MLRGNSMTAYLSKQHSCFADLDGKRDYGNCYFGSPHQHHCHQRRHHQHHQYGSVPGGATLPRRGRLRTWHLDQTSGSSSRLAATRAKGRSCDLWPSECGCTHSWQEAHQVKGMLTVVTRNQLLNSKMALLSKKATCGMWLSLLRCCCNSHGSAPHLQLELSSFVTDFELTWGTQAVKLRL